jgi:hypothetical protein
MGSALLAAGCGSEDDGDGGVTPVDGACTKDGSMCLTLHVPDDYAATPRQIIVGLYEDPALAGKGPPVEVPGILDAPTIGAGMPLEIEFDDMTADGSFAIYIALYNEGGGMYQPVPGVDYIWQTDDKLRIGGAPVNLGDIYLHLLED